MKTSEQINEIAAALAKAQSKIKGAAKDSVNPHFKSSYADLSSVWEACREALTKEGIAVAQSPSFDGTSVSVTTRLLHSSGQWIEGVLSAFPSKPDAQGVGSTITYLRRYSLASFAGVAPEDDDGEAAVGRQSAQSFAGEGKPAVKVAPKASTVEEKLDDSVKLLAMIRKKLASCKSKAEIDETITNCIKAKTPASIMSPAIAFAAERSNFLEANNGK